MNESMKQLLKLLRDKRNKFLIVLTLLLIPPTIYNIFMALNDWGNFKALVKTGLLFAIAGVVVLTILITISGISQGTMRGNTIYKTSEEVEQDNNAMKVGCIMGLVSGLLILFYVPACISLFGSESYKLELRILDVCNGKILPEAATYDRETPHKIYVLELDPHDYLKDDLEIASLKLPSGWKADRIDNLQLVACISQDSILIERCSYDEEGEKIADRMQYMMDIEIFSVQSGKNIAAYQLLGGTPRQCKSTEIFEIRDGRTITTFIYGSSITEQQFIDSIKPYVNP